MFRKILFIAATILLTFSFVSNAALVALEEAAELSIKSVRLPTSTGGRLTYSNCSGCKLMIWRVVPETRYQLLISEESAAASEVTLDVFRQIFDSGQAEDMVVFYKPDTNEVTRLFMSRKH